MHHHDLSYVPEVIKTKLTRRHHNESTSALGKLENSLPGDLQLLLIPTHC